MASRILPRRAKTKTRNGKATKISRRIHCAAVVLYKTLLFNSQGSIQDAAQPHEAIASDLVPAPHRRAAGNRSTVIQHTIYTSPVHMVMLYISSWKTLPRGAVFSFSHLLHWYSVPPTLSLHLNSSVSQWLDRVMPLSRLTRISCL